MNLYISIQSDNEGGISIPISKKSLFRRDSLQGDVMLSLTEEEFKELAKLFSEWMLSNEKISPVFEKTPGTVEQFRSWVSKLKDIANPRVNYDPDVEVMKDEVITKSRSLSSEVFMEIEDFLAAPRRVLD